MARGSAPAASVGMYRGGSQIAAVTSLPPVVMQAYASGTILDANGTPIDPAVFRAPQDFGPGQPIAPRVLDPRQPPRVWQYPLATNTNVTPRGDNDGPSFASLRALANWCDYLRIAIKIRKDQMRAQPWTFFDPTADTAEKRAANSAQVQKLTEFWMNPCKIAGLDWPSWVAQVIEEVFVTDALALWAVPQFDGEPHSILQIDGATLNMIIDGMGITQAAQQIIRGYPTSQYDIGTEVIPWEGGPAKPYILKPSLIMKQYDPRIDSAYGTSVVEEIYNTIQTLIKKQLTELAWYTEGNIPTMFVEAPQNYTPNQIEQLQTLFDDMLAGDEAQRHKMRVVPHGSNPVQAKPFTFSIEQEQVLSSKVCALMGIPRYLLMSDVNKSTAASTDDANADYGLRALQVFICGLVNQSNAWVFGETKLKFKFTREPGSAQFRAQESRVKMVTAGILTDNEARAEEGLLPKPVSNGINPSLIQRAFLEAGFIRINEMRRSIGLDPIPGEAGEAFIAIGAFGVQDEGSLEDVAAKPKAPPAQGQSATAGGKPMNPPADDVPDEAPTVDAAEKELGAWRRWAQKRDGKQVARPFTFECIPDEISTLISTMHGVLSPSEIHDIARARLAKLKEKA